MAQRRTMIPLLIGLLGAPWPLLPAATPDPTADERFEKQIRPILANRCQSCHGETKRKGDLRLDSRAGILAGGRTGPAVVPGNPEESLLVEAIRYGDLFQMPPKSKLPDAEIALLTRWVAEGAPWPAEPEKPAASKAAVRPFDLRERAKHWSFQPVRPSAPPAVRRAGWARNAIDLHILAALEAKGLGPAPEADRRTLIRRLSFDLTGLPPTPAEVEAFLAEQSPTAYEALVDRLLASPHYGERWGRHWLDLVRFAETAGHEFDYEYPDAYRYRDYVIRAFNADLPYDRLVVEHIAGDLLEPARRHPSEGFNESVLGTGFYFLGEGTHSPVDVRDDGLARVDNQIDVLSKTFLGLTVSCARCHDHKFDAISTRDYYALSGYLRSSRHDHAFIDPPERIHVKAVLLRGILGELASSLGASSGGSPPPSPGPARSDATVVFEDFDGPRFGAWTVSGDAFGDRPTREGDLRPRLDEVPPSVFRVAPGLAHSGLISRRLQGVLRSPTFTIGRRFIHYLAQGERARINVVVDGFEKIRDPIYGVLTRQVETGGGSSWITQDVGMWRGHRAYIELADGGAVDFSGASSRYVDGQGYVAVDRILFSDEVAPDRPAPLESGPIPIDGSPGLSPPEGLIDRYLAVEAAIPEPNLGPAITDGTAEDEHVLIRGSARTPGPLVGRRFLEAIAGPDQPAPRSGSGRLDLARRIADPANPLTARVLVNRLWKHHFGEGLVATPDDFGAMGRPPTHPALLDELAARFVAEGWSIKRMQRLMVLSSTYRMSSRPEPGSAAETADPTNVWLHRMNLRRLEAEAVRDALLAVSGRLDRRLYGPGVAPHLTPFMQGRGRPLASGPLEGDGRRSLYLNVRRNFLTPMLLAFDFPTPFSTMGRRNVSNVPAQALTLLNDPFVVEEARRWAGVVLGSGDRPAAERLDALYLAAFGRPPTDSERSEALAFLAQLSGTYGRPDDVRAWADLCHVLINVKEFLYVN